MDVDKTWQAWARGDHLEVVNYWWWSGSACGFQITFWCSSPLHAKSVHFRATNTIERKTT